MQAKWLAQIEQNGIWGKEHDKCETDADVAECKL